MRVGTGWDIHKLEEGRNLVLGGMIIPWTKGEYAHSDGDVLIHALIDSLLGAASLGDIGTFFPPSDPSYKDIKSTVLLEKVKTMIEEEGFFIENIDSTIILEKPKLNNYIRKIEENLSIILNIGPERISVKAKTREGLGDVGEGIAIEAHASVLLGERDESVWV